MLRLAFWAFSIWSTKKTFDLMKENVELKKMQQDSEATIRTLAKNFGKTPEVEEEIEVEEFDDQIGNGKDSFHDDEDEFEKLYTAEDEDAHEKVVKEMESKYGTHPKKSVIDTQKALDELFSLLFGGKLPHQSDDNSPYPDSFSKQPRSVRKFVD